MASSWEYGRFVDESIPRRRMAVCGGGEFPMTKKNIWLERCFVQALGKKGKEKKRVCNLEKKHWNRVLVLETQSSWPLL